MPTKSIQIAIADDEALFRKGLGLLLEDYEDLSIVMEAENGQDLLNQLYATEEQPDVLLLDMKMPVLNGVETAKLMREHFPDIPIVILSTHFSKAFILNMIEIFLYIIMTDGLNPCVFKRLMYTKCVFFHVNTLRIIERLSS